MRDTKRFYFAYSEKAIWRQLAAKFGHGDGWVEFLRQLVAEIPWGHHLVILDKLTDPAARLWYLQDTTRFGWTRNVLLNQVKAGAYERNIAEKKTNNFPAALPEHLAEQADEMLKSSYTLEFRGIRRAVKELELEDRPILQQWLDASKYGHTGGALGVTIPINNSIWQDFPSG